MCCDRHLEIPVVSNNTELWVRIILMQILMPYFELSLVFFSKISPEKNTDIDFPYPKLEIYKKRHKIFTSQKR